jgi:nucleoside 2-deoxyribosyltransferase
VKKIYIAGFDVFNRNSIEIEKNYIYLCEKYGFSGHYPLDNRIDFNQEKKKEGAFFWEQKS